MQFDVAHALLLEAFSIPATNAKSFQMVRRYLHGACTSLDEENKVKALLSSKNARRSAFNFMVEMRDVTPHVINSSFPLGEKRNRLELWLDGKSSYLP